MRTLEPLGSKRRNAGGTRLPVGPAARECYHRGVRRGRLGTTGDLGKYGAKLPWADSGLQLNIGAEWRQESSSFLPDYLSQQGSAAGSGGATPPVSGRFHRERSVHGNAPA